MAAESPSSRLRPHADELLRQLRRHGSVRRIWIQDAAALLEHALAIDPTSKTANAIARQRELSRVIEDGIRQAAGATPPKQRGAAGIVQRRIARRGPAAYGLSTIPCIKTIRRVLQTMATEQDREKNTGNDVT